MNESSWLDKLSMPEQGYYLYLAAFGFAISVAMMVAAIEGQDSPEDE